MSQSCRSSPARVVGAPEPGDLLPELGGRQPRTSDASIASAQAAPSSRKHRVSTASSGHPLPPIAERPIATRYRRPCSCLPLHGQHRARRHAHVVQLGHAAPRLPLPALPPCRASAWTEARGAEQLRGMVVRRFEVRHLEGLVLLHQAHGRIRQHAAAGRVAVSAARCVLRIVPAPVGAAVADLRSARRCSRREQGEVASDRLNRGGRQVGALRQPAAPGRPPSPGAPAAAATKRRRRRCGRPRRR